MANWNPFEKCSDENTLIETRILGSCLCLAAMSQGDVCLFHFMTGEFIYRLNTNAIYVYPEGKIVEALGYSNE